MNKKIIIEVSVILMVISAFFLFNWNQENTKSGRAVAMSMLSCTLPSDTFVIVTLSELSPECRNAIDLIDRPSDKKIIAYNKQWNITLNFDLIESGNQKVWKCKGNPLKLFPKQCR